MRPGKRSATARVEAIILTLDYFLQHPQGKALYRSADGAYLRDLAKHITTARVAGCSPTRLQNLVKGKVKYIRKWKAQKRLFRF